MKPSCAVTKLIDATGRRPDCSYRSARTGQPARELPERRLAAPEVAHRVAELAVPLGPLRREVADLVATVADVPRLGDQLHLADDRVLLHELEERRQPVDVVELAGQRRREVEAEAVDVHLGHPVAQRVHDQLQRVGVADVEAVPGAGVVHVVARVVLDEPVVRRVVEALEAQRRAEVVALGGVVVDDVEDHLDAGRVQRPDHRLELLHLLAELTGRGVLGLRGEEAEGVVAPVVAQALVEQGAVLDELVHRHQLDRGHPEPGQVVDHRRVRETGVRPALVLRYVGMQLGEPLDVGLVDQRLGVRRVGPAVALPVEERVDDDAEHHVRPGVVVVAASRGRRSRSRTATGPSRCRRRSPWRRGRAAACSGCSAGPSAGRRCRAPGSRSAGPAAPTAGSSARRTRRPRSSSPGSRCARRRTDTARPARPPR